MLNNSYQSRARVTGVTLIELMVALVAGLIVSGAALALIVAIMKSNADNIRATRLTQELRTTAEVVARDLRRARGIDDPIANIGVDSADMVKACNAITPASGSTSSCVTFAYDCVSATSGTFRAIALADGKVRIATSDAAVPACPTASTGTQLSSDLLTINAFDVEALNDAYTIRLEGRFTSDSAPAPLIRKISQEVRIRSAAVNLRSPQEIPPCNRHAASPGPFCSLSLSCCCWLASCPCSH
jgi:Tfp pilus assembly protein PilW